MPAGPVDAAPDAAGPFGVDPAGTAVEDGLPANLGKNVAVNYLSVAAGLLSALLVTPLMLHLLGTARFGVWVLAGSVVTYIQLFDLGFGVASIKMMAADAYRRPDSVIRTLNTNFFALCLLGALALAIGLTVAVFSPHLFGVPPGLRGDTVVLFGILAVAFAVSVPFDVLGGALAAHQRYDLLSIANVTLTITSTWGAVLAVALGGGLVSTGVVAAVAATSVQYIRFRMVARLVPGVRLAPRLVDRSRLRDTTSTSGWFLLRDVTDVVINQVDLLVVGLLLGVRAVAVYAVALKAAQLGRRAMLPLSQVFFPHASSLAANEDESRLGQLLVDGTRVSMLVAIPIMLVLTVFGRPALHAWVGGTAAQAVTVLLLLAVARGLTAVTDTAWWLLAGAGWIRVTATVSVVEAVVNLGLSVAFARPLGPEGVALGTLVGVAGVGLPASVLMAGRLTGVPFPRFLRQTLLPHALPTAVVAAALAGARLVVPGEPPQVVAVAAAAFALYLTVYLRLSATPAERARAARLSGRLSGRLRGRARRDAGGTPPDDLVAVPDASGKPT